MIRMLIKIITIAYVSEKNIIAIKPEARHCTDARIANPCLQFHSPGIHVPMTLLDAFETVKLHKARFKNGGIKR